MDKIVIKEIGRYVNTRFPQKKISEYLIYVCAGNVRVSAYSEIYGEQAKIEKVNELLIEYFTTDDNREINTDGIIEEVSLINNKILTNG